MQQFSTTLAGSHSPHDQSNSLSLSALFPLNCMRHAPRTVAREELQFECGKQSAVVHHGAFRTRFHQGLFSLSPFSLFTCRFASFSNVAAVLFYHVDLVEPTFSTRDSGLCRPYGKSESNRQKIAHLADIWPTPRLITIHDQIYAF